MSSGRWPSTSAFSDRSACARRSAIRRTAEPRRSSISPGASSSSGSGRPADGGEHQYYSVGLEHLAFYVDTPEEVDGAYQRCLDMGVQIHFPPEEDKDIEGYYELFVFDPDGLRIEVAYGPISPIGG